MNPEPIILGGIATTDWQIPEQVHGIGGKQRAATHQVFGQRVVDTLGPDESNITWSGRFRGPDALDNAQAWDAMRIAGLQLPLYVIGISRTVIIEEFIWEPQKPYEIPYKITCLVVVNPMAGNQNMGVGTLDDLVNGDMDTVSNVGSTGVIAPTMDGGQSPNPANMGSTGGPG